MANPFAVALKSMGSLGEFGTKGLQIFYNRTSLPQSLTSSAATGLSSNVLMSPVMWVMRALTESLLIVQRREVDAGGGLLWHRSLDHDVELLVRRPNAFYNGDALWKGTALSYTMDGNAYWLKVRNQFGDPIQLWYVPHWMMRPEWPLDGSQFISHYTMTTDVGPPIPLATRDVVHTRFGIDPENKRLGYSPLKAILREVLTDDEASRFSESILGNMGVPGLIISPAKDATPGHKPDKDEIQRMQDYFNTAFSKERRGKAFVMGRPTEVSQFGFDPNKLMLPNLRDISEERVCAALGIPSAVVGFGSGLQSTKVGATMRELVKLARVQCLNPMLWTFGETLTEQLLPDFVGEKFRQTFRCRFDVSEVSAFQEDAKAEAERIALLVREGILRVDRAQQVLGLEVDRSRSVYLKSEVSQSSGNSDRTLANTEPQAEPSADDTDDDDADEQKMLRGIAARLNLPALTNGNGTH